MAMLSEMLERRIS